MTNTTSYPIPVLGGGVPGNSDVASRWEVKDITVETMTEDVPIRMRVCCDDPDLKKLLDAGDVAIKARWDCPSTFSSGYLDLSKIQPHADGATYESSIDQRMICNWVTVSIFVVACRNIPGFHWERQHPDYGDAAFDVSAGDLLAVPQQFSFIPEKLYDPQRPPLNSIFNIVRDNSRKEGIRTELGQDQIEVQCGKDLFDNLQLWTSARLQLMSVVFPALIDAIGYMQENEALGENGDLSMKWCSTLRELIQSAGLKTDKRPLELAQKLLRQPIDGFLDEYTNQIKGQ
ncbi:hypothetical protein PSRA_1008 [Pseudoscardovia radai]|uniref:Uncharacterized protein n=1 Tax=Pseudoscardovia radai TaxID=987066 RepID=A0A261EXN1_9BIFI|nr:hypothetical protein [Pseudoscardovia radai]OZG51611.1 hypothetical protein PSRA_1008 [Pseudoscardovia radai]